MSGPKRPMELNLAVAKGGKHWTKAEIERRQSQELKLPKPRMLKAPKWLDPEARKLFSHYAKLLLAFPEGIVSELDTGTLARYCDCELSYAEASRQKLFFLDECRQLRVQAESDGKTATDFAGCEAYAAAQKQVDYWSGQMARFEKICRGCAADMGLTVTSRCKLVVPQVELAQEADPLADLQKMFLGNQVASSG